MRLKEDIRITAKDARDIVRRINVYDYRYIDRQAEHTGFLAQELDALYPEAVGRLEDRRVVGHRGTVGARRPPA